ncbi:SagB/ThcOx family dehydrogenase [bacterium]|nr:SagB/ThcOx family dehydrogenase [bacterium]
MNHFIAHLFAEARSSRFTKHGATQKAENVPRGLHKHYPRFERILLPTPSASSFSLTDALEQRVSGGEMPAAPLSLQQLGDILGYGLGCRPETVKRNYPSGGALYPIETYLITTSVLDLVPGAFHYNPTHHALERLLTLEENFAVTSCIPGHKNLAVNTLLVFTSVWERSSAKYGHLSFIHGLLEAGHMSQNILLLATARGIPARPMAGFDDTTILKLLDLNPEVEQPVHSITLP